MPTNQYLPFAAGAGANTLTPTAYAALTSILASGFSPGVASSEQFNTFARQVSVVAAALAQWAADTSGNNAMDDGSVANFKALLNAALSAKTAPYVQKAGDTMAGPLNIYSLWGTSGMTSGTGDGASYTTYNIVMKGWWGLGMIDNSDVCRGYYNFRTGDWDVKGGYYVNGVRVWDATNFNPGSYVSKAGDTMTGALNVPGIINSANYLFAEAGNDSGLVHLGDNNVSIRVAGVDALAVSPALVASNVTFRAASMFAISAASPTSQGSWVGWNASGGGGESNFYCNKGTGTGGFTFTISNGDGTTASVPLSIASNGIMTVQASPAAFVSNYTLATTLHVTDKLNAAISSGSNGSGTYMLINGIALQCGFLSASDGTFSFPLTFSSVAAVMFCPSQQGALSDCGVAYPMSTSQFYAGTRGSHGTASGMPGYWLAIGTF